MPEAFRPSAFVPRLLITTGLFVPTLLFSVAVWVSWRDAMAEGQATVLKSISVMADSIHGLMATEEHTLDEVVDHLRNLSWEEIAKPETSQYLAQLSSTREIAAISISNREGRIVASSLSGQIGRYISDQKFFALDQHGGRYISATFSEQSNQPISIAMIVRRSASDGSFDGTVQADLELGHLTGLFTDETAGGGDVLIVGAGGETIDLHGDRTELKKLRTDDPLMRDVAAHPQGGELTGDFGGLTEREAFHAPVPGYPVWVGIIVDQSVLVSRWSRNLKTYSAAAATGVLALLGASWWAIRQTRREQTALVSLHAETERRLVAEQRMSHAHRLETVGQLAGGIAHDFNNLLTVIVGSLELLARANEPNPRVQSLIATATRAAQRGASLTTSLLAFARRQVLQPNTVDLNQEIAEFLPIIKQTLGEIISVELNLEPVLAHCLADTVRLEAAVLNLVINARDAMPNGGTLTIETRHAVLDRDVLADNPEARPGAFIAMSLADTGIGMSQEVAIRAVEPFFTTKEVGKGSGLGLSHVLGFVRQLGGHIMIEAELGRGSVVTIFLPQA